MDNLEDTIKSALNDPDIMSKVSSVMSSLGKSSQPGQAPDISKLMPTDDRTRLLLALKPFLSEKRAPYMDSAINILKLVSIGKIGKDLNLL